MTRWRCIVCGFIHQGQKPPSHCPICGAPASMFEKVEVTKDDGGGCHSY